MTQSQNDKTTGGAEVISLWQHQARKDTSAISDLRAYWDELRCGRMTPLRSEIDPREISGTLEYGFILERLQPGAIRFRLAGMHLSDLMGMEVRGMPLRSFISPTSRARFSAMLERVFTQPEIHEYIMVSEGSAGKMLKARMIVLPLRSESGKVDRAIGCMTTEGVVGLAPRRFQVTETRVKNLTTGGETREVDKPMQPPVHQEDREPTTGFAENQTPFQAAPTAPPNSTERPHLRLVVSDTQS